jgi:hypothetical protein
VALPLAITATTLAYQDLKRMRAGDMGPAGHDQTERARLLACSAILIGTVGALFGVILFQQLAQMVVDL